MIKPTKKQIAFMNFTNEEIKYELNVECRELNKDLSNLMECLRKQEKDNKAILFVGRNFKKVILPYEEYQKMYQRLEAIDNAKPSEALNCIEKVNDYLKNVYDYKEIIEEVQRDINTIKQALNKAQEQEKENAEYKKVLEILKPYLRLVDNFLQARVNFYDDYWLIVKEITDEKELDSLKKILGQTQI